MNTNLTHGLYGCVMASWTDGLFLHPDVVLQGNNGSWTTIAADQYDIHPARGAVTRRPYDDSDAAVDWSSYTAFRASYALYDPTTNTASYTTNETQTVSELDFGVAPFDPITGRLNQSTAPLNQYLVGNYLSLGDVGTRPYDSSHGTGIWADKTGIYGLNADTRQFYLDAATGKAYAGGGAVTLDANGIAIVTTISDTNYLEFKDGSLKVGSVFGTSDTVSTPTNSGLTISANWNGDYVVGETSLRALGDSGELAQFSVSAGYGLNYAQLTLDSVGAGGFTIQKGGSGTNTSLLTLASTAPTFRMEDLTGSAKSLLITVDGNKATFEEAGGTDVMVLDLANARVGIGTASPTEIFEVNTTTANRGARLVYTGASSSSVGSRLGLFVNDGAAMASADRIGALEFGGYDGAAVSISAYLIATATEAWSGTARGSKLTFYTTPNTTTTTTAALAIEQDQKVTMNAAASVATKFYINESADANVTIGASFNQGGNDDYILTLKSTDVSHVMTGVGEADTYCSVGKVNASRGGVEFSGYKEAGDGTAGNAVRIRGYLGTTANTTHNATGAAVIDLSAAVTDGGTGVTGPAANSNLVSISSNNAIKFLFDADGDSFEDGTGWTAYDAHDDVALLDRMNRVMLDAPDRIKANFLEWVGLNARELEALNLISIGENSLFINRSKMQELLVGSVRQLGARLDRLEQAQGRLNG